MVCYRDSFTVLSQKHLLTIETILQDANKFQHGQFYFLPCLKMIGHGHPENNLELHCIIKNMEMYF
jgi:hypothetical protein